MLNLVEQVKVIIGSLSSSLSKCQLNTTTTKPQTRCGRPICGQEVGKQTYDSLNFFENEVRIGDWSGREPAWGEATLGHETRAARKPTAMATNRSRLQSKHPVTYSNAEMVPRGLRWSGAKISTLPSKQSEAEVETVETFRSSLAGLFLDRRIKWTTGLSW